MRKCVVAGLVASTLACGSAQAADGRNAALIGGLAAGVAGGAILGAALSQPRPAPVYYAPPPPPPPQVEYIEPAPRRVVQPVALGDPDDRMYRLHGACDAGNRSACIRFGVLIGQHRERVAQWRRSHPDFFSYED